MTTLAVGEEGFIPDSGGNEQRTLRQAAAAAGVQTGNPLAINPIAMTMADPEGGGGITAGIGAINTLAVGEQGGSILNPGGGGGNFGPPNLGTLAIPENGGSIGPVTMAVGEDGGGFTGGAVTRMLGETGGNIGNPNLTTLASPENGNGMPPLQRLPGAGGAMTLAFPESGGGFNPPNNMTRLLFENGRPPQTITQAAGIGEDGRPPIPVTQAIGEDGAIGSPSIPGQNPFDFSTFKTDLLTGIGDLFKKYFDETSSPFGGNEITPPPAPGETNPGDLVAPSSNYGSLASKGMQSPFRGL